MKDFGEQWLQDLEQTMKVVRKEELRFKRCMFILCSWDKTFLERRKKAWDRVYALKNNYTTMGHSLVNESLRKRSL